MTKSTKILILIMVIILIIFGILLTVDNVKADDTDSKQIAQYEYQINELRKQKELCYDNLTYDESISARDGFTKPCVQWDEEIMALREKADNLKAKSYDKVGLE